MLTLTSDSHDLHSLVGHVTNPWHRHQPSLCMGHMVTVGGGEWRCSGKVLLEAANHHLQSTDCKLELVLQLSPTNLKRLCESDWAPSVDMLIMYARSGSVFYWKIYTRAVIYINQ